METRRVVRRSQSLASGLVWGGLPFVPRSGGRVAVEAVAAMAAYEQLQGRLTAVDMDAYLAEDEPAAPLARELKPNQLCAFAQGNSFVHDLPAPQKTSSAKSAAGRELRQVRPRLPEPRHPRERVWRFAPATSSSPGTHSQSMLGSLLAQGAGPHPYPRVLVYARRSGRYSVGMNLPRRAKSRWRTCGDSARIFRVWVVAVRSSHCSRSSQLGRMAHNSGRSVCWRSGWSNCGVT